MSQFNGATTILYDGWLGAFAEKNQADVYILPSSIHELILILDDKEMGAERLQEMVKEVNRTQVENDEVLSDSIYYYCRENQEITKFV